MGHKTNIQIIKKSKIRPKPGDIFAIKLPNKIYIFGLVIYDSGNSVLGEAPMPFSILVNIFDLRSIEMKLDIDTLERSPLLTPPLWINALAWGKGYLFNIDSVATSDSNRPSQNYFYDSFRKLYLDGFGKCVDKRIEPCGQWGLQSYRTLDDIISDALKIPRVS